MLTNKEIENLATARQNTTLKALLNNITRELKMGTDTSIKSTSSPREGTGVIKELVEDCIFPASNLWVTYSSSGAISHTSTATVV